MVTPTVKQIVNTASNVKKYNKNTFIEAYMLYKWIRKRFVVTLFRTLSSSSSTDNGCCP